MAFLAVEPAAGPDGRRGSAGWVWSKGWLPYTLRFEFDVTELPGAPAVIVRAAGDFEGCCVCTVMARGLEGFRLELGRRRGETGLDEAPVPRPPGPTFPYGRRYRRLWLLAARVASAWAGWGGSPAVGEEAGG